MSKLTEIVKELNKGAKHNLICNVEDVSFSSKGIIPLPSPALEYIFHGGLPTQILVEILGPFSSGKSAFCMGLTGNAQKMFKEQFNNEVEFLSNLENPNKTQKVRLAELQSSGCKKVVWLDSEHSFDPDWARKFGIDIDELQFIKPQEESAEMLLDVILALVESNEVGLVVVDSLATLSSASALKKSLEEKTYCGIAGPLTTWASKLLPLLSKYDCTVVCINQERDVLNAMFPTTNSPGGRAFKHACHVRLKFRQGKMIDTKYNEIANNSIEAFGQISEVQVLKNKVTKPDRRMCKFTITFDDGISAENDVFLLAVALEIIDKSGAWFSVLDEDGAVKNDSEGNPLKWQGKPNAIEYLKTHPEYMNTLTEQVREKIL